MWQQLHSGWGSPLSKNKLYRHVWPILTLISTHSSRRTRNVLAGGPNLGSDAMQSVWNSLIPLAPQSVTQDLGNCWLDVRSRQAYWKGVQMMGLSRCLIHSFTACYTHMVGYPAEQYFFTFIIEFFQLAENAHHKQVFQYAVINSF